MSKSVLLWCPQIHAAHAAGQYFWAPLGTLKISENAFEKRYRKRRKRESPGDPKMEPKSQDF